MKLTAIFRKKIKLKETNKVRGFFVSIPLVRVLDAPVNSGSIFPIWLMSRSETMLHHGKPFLCILPRRFVFLESGPKETACLSKWQVLASLKILIYLSLKWIAYLERINFYFVANGIEKIEQKKAILLTLIGPETFSLARSLAAPKSLNEIDFSELIKLLTDHFCPKPQVIVQRYHFNKKNQGLESVSAYVAELRKLSENCEFVDLDDRLRIDWCVA
ncbi:hypothetical protein LAZ67_21001490 [Cordylochernes scorpioides]|uniref:Retrotransposon gag domain-containing protein n=1 Tax=Cordylochernes scorpioides TaxID=51811 RepID=A0ABY6LPN5_9ARAC|nr:hypothetical protein LAZ67_21001490 [Cordylochernes scorpioides]